MNEPEIVILPELLAAYRRRSLRRGVPTESEQEIRAALRCRRCVQTEVRERSDEGLAPPLPADDPLNQRGLASLIDSAAGSWIDNLDVELATRGEMR